MKKAELQRHAALKSLLDYNKAFDARKVNAALAAKNKEINEEHIKEQPRRNEMERNIYENFD